MTLCLLLILSAFADVLSSQSCSQFEVVSNLQEGPFLSPTCGLSFHVLRTTLACADDRSVFFTRRVTMYPLLNLPFTCNADTGLGSCIGTCASQAVTVTASCIVGGVQRQCPFEYVIKNCDVLNWGPWSPSATCTESSEASLYRSCYDCDETSVDEKFCDGEATRTEPCSPSWGEWVNGDCQTINCNRNGLRTKSRRCLYGNGMESQNRTLCSTDPATIVELCQINQADCTTSSSTTVKTTSTSLVTETTTTKTTSPIDEEYQSKTEYTQKMSYTTTAVPKNKPFEAANSSLGLNLGIAFGVFLLLTVLSMVLIIGIKLKVIKIFKRPKLSEATVASDYSTMHTATN